MKIKVLIVFYFFLSHVKSQDIIYKLNGDYLIVKQIEQDSSSVKYQFYNKKDKSTHILSKLEISRIRYENGNIDTLDKLLKASLNIQKDSSNLNIDLYSKGENDALNNYYKYHGAATGTLLTSLLSPLIGLIPAIACASSNPPDHNLNYPDSELMKNKDYAQGYRDKAKKRKVGKIWANWGIGLGVNFVAILLLSK